MTLPAVKLTPADHFDARALGMLNRFSPSIMAAAFGVDAVRANPAVSLGTVIDETWRASGGTGVPNINAMLTTSDFQKILADTVGAAALASYILSYPDILRLSHETKDIVDFRPVKKVQGGMFPALLPPGEGGEVRYGTIGERGESYQAAIVSRMVEFTTEVLKNDNLGLLMQPSLRIGETVADYKATVLANLIESNPVLSDGHPVFYAGHGNLAASGANLDVTTLSNARTAMRRQKDVDGVRGIGVEPVFVLVPPERETDTEKVLAQITASTVDDANPFANKLRLIVEHRLTSHTAWYVFTRPERQMTLEHGTVDGMEDPEIRTESPIGRHSVITRVSTTFGAGWLDYRGAYKNPG